MKHHTIFNGKCPTVSEKGISFMEVLVCLSILSLSVAAILEIYACMVHTFILHKVYYLGQTEVHNKIEEYHALNFSEIQAGMYKDKPFFFIEREWKITRVKSGFVICAQTVSTGGIELSHKCIRRTANE